MPNRAKTYTRWLNTFIRPPLRYAPHRDEADEIQFKHDNASRNIKLSLSEWFGEYIEYVTHPTPIVFGIKSKVLSAELARRVTRAKILVVEDDHLTLQLLARILIKEGHQVDTVDNGHDAIGKITSERYDLLLLDIHIPYMSGFELYEHIQEMSPSLASRVIFMTGKCNTHKANVSHFLSEFKVSLIIKPFDLEQLKWNIYRTLTQDA